MRSISNTRPTSCMAGYLRRTASASSALVWIMIQRRSASTCWRCWPSSEMMEFWNKKLPVVGDEADSREFPYLLRTFCNASVSWISIVGGSYVMIPSVSNFFSSLCREERDTFITIAQLDTESGILITFLLDCLA